MIDDEIVAEVRQIRDAYAKKFDYDLRAIFRDLKEKERSSGREYVSHPAKKPALEPVSSGRKH